MKKIICLIRIFLKSGTGKDAGEKGRRSLVSSAAFVLSAVVLAALCFAGGKYAGMYIGKSLDTGALMNSILMAMAVVVGILTVPAIMNVFYLASGMGTLLVMPVTAAQIAVSKLAVLSLQGYGIFLAVFLPFAAGYGIYTKALLSFWAGVFCSVICVPVVTLCILSVILMVFMRIFHRARNKDLIAVVGAAGSMIAMLGVSALDFAGKGGTQMEQMLHKAVDLVGHMAFLVPVIPLVGKLFGGGSLWWIAISLGVTALAVLLFLLTAKGTYLTGVLGMQDTSHSAANLSEAGLYKKTQAQKAVWSYTVKELKTVVRTPAFLLQGVMFSLGWPLLVLVSGVFARGEESGAETLMEITGSQEMLALTVFGIASAVTVFAAAMNNTAVLSVSREGASFYIMKQLPISYKKQLKAKRNAAMLICAAGSTLYLLIAGAVLACMGILPVWMVSFALVINVSILYLILDIQMMIGLARPKLVWENDAEIGKKNVSGVIIMIIGLTAVAAVLIGIAIMLDEIGLSPVMLLAATAALGMICAFMANQMFYRYGVKQMERL